MRRCRLTKNIPIYLPDSEVAKVQGSAAITQWGHLEFDAYNGSSFVLTELTLTVSVFDQHGKPVISNRDYRMPILVSPQSSGKFGTDAGFSLEPDQTWQFYIAGAKGTRE